MTVTAQSMPRTARILILALAIFATLGLSVASATHIDSSPGDCTICFVAHTVAFETPAIHPLWVPGVVSLTFESAPVVGYRACGARHVSSRGPPSLLQYSV